MKKVTIYTDGACSGNPGPGGWGAILIYEEIKKEISGFSKETTNNIMEMTAVIEALKLLKYPCELTIYSDSAYVVNAFEKGWIESWKEKGWKNSSKETVKNKELWEEMLRLLEPNEYSFQKVKGHSDNELNNRCDFLATNAIKEATKE